MSTMLEPLVWIDMEMSGLDPDRDRILEIAILISDGALERIVEGPEIVLHQGEDVLAAMDAWNTEHHTGSGLLERVRCATMDETGAERELLSFVRAHCPPGVAPLAGNSIHQDRMFLRRWMPRLHGHLHYRNVDVSTLKELLRRWAPEIVETAPVKREGHRALQDIRESIEELRHYRARAFRLGSSGPN
jgi:oligoribonuclease